MNMPPKPMKSMPTGTPDQGPRVADVRPPQVPGPTMDARAIEAACDADHLDVPDLLSQDGAKPTPEVYRERIARMVREANKIGSAAYTLSKQINAEGVAGCEEHDRAARAHAYATRLHMDVSKMAEIAGDGLTAMYHNEMSDHHSELHSQHKHEANGRLGEVFRADTKPLIRAFAAMERHYRKDVDMGEEACVESAAGEEVRCLAPESLDPRVAIPAFLEALEKAHPAAHTQFMLLPFGTVPSYAQEDPKSDWWTSEEALSRVDQLREALEEAAPEGYVFGLKAGVGYGFWPDLSLAKAEGRLR